MDRRTDGQPSANPPSHPGSLGSPSHARWRPLVRHAAIGVITGLAILGLGGRAAMVVTSWLLGLPVGLTVRGTLAVVATGGIYGALAGGCSHIVGRLPRSRPVRTVILGTGTFLVIAVISTANRQTGPAWQYPGRTIALFLPLAWAWAYAFLRMAEGRRG